MNLNPLTLIEDLINEHGSSVIQGKHLALLKEQIAILKEQLALGASQLSNLQTENERLKTENSDLRQKLDKLKKPQPRGAWGSQTRIKGRMEQ
jgi:regulator of replication initiation timing